MDTLGNYLYTLVNSGVLNTNAFIATSDRIFTFLINHQTPTYVWCTLLLVTVTSIDNVKMMIANGMLNKRLAHMASERPRILNEGMQRHILVVGDSTAYGTGSDSIEDTITGRFAHDFPQVEVNNMAVNGSCTKDVLRQLEQAPPYAYNLIIISTGGNDTWRLTSFVRVEQQLREVLVRSKQIAGNNVVVLIYNNVASGPVFPIIIRPIILWRTKRINEIFIHVSKEFEIEPIPVFLPGEKCRPDFFSRDGLHPSSEGYRIMYIRLWAVLYRRIYDFNLRDY